MKLNKLQTEIFQTRHAISSEETYDQAAERVAKHIAQAESNDKKEEWTKIFTDIIQKGWFSPGGRVTFGSGRKEGQLLNCFVLVPEDNIQSIGQTISDMYQISCKGGGCGFSFGKIRPKGDNIAGMVNSAPGSVSVMKMINEIAEHVRAGASRRTALMSILPVNHPDLLEFLHVKLDLHELNNFNISVAVTDAFLEAVKANKSWYFEFRGQKYYMFQGNRILSDGSKEVVKTTALSKEDALGRFHYSFKKNSTDTFTDIKQIELKARDIWEVIVENAVKVGDPGIYHIDLANRYTNVSYFEKMDATNPCGEIPIGNKCNCCLGNINLSDMYDENIYDVDWKRLAYVVRSGVRFLDNVLTVNNYPVDGCKEAAENSRRIGLGVLGLHYLLLKLDYRYGSEKCIEFIERLFATIRNEAYLASIDIAKEKGSFIAFDKEKYLNEGFAQTLPVRIKQAIAKYGIRNAVMLTVPPTGNTGMVLGVSTGIEPIFAPAYERTFRENNIWKTVLVIDKLFEEFILQDKDVSHFVGAHDVTVEEHLAVQAAIQKFIDSSISKTINIPENAESKEISQLILDYIPYLKGVTIYRTGSRGIEPLKPVKITPEIIEQIKSNKNVDVNVYGTECATGTCSTS